MIASLASATRFKFATALRTKYLVGDLDLLEGESTVLGKIQRKLNRGEKQLVASLFGGLEELLPEAQLEEFIQSMESPVVRQLGLESPLLEYPAAILTPIAIYR
jgi:hypothetical protein